jgi:hypothetical protein
MTKVRLNLRKVAMIIACLSVTTIFATCDNRNTDDDDGGKGNGKIDTKLVGRWTRSSGGASPSTFYWLINNDGTFHYYLVSSAEYSYRGKYSASNGRIDFTNVVFTNAGMTPIHVSNEPDSWVSYEIVRDDWGDQLRISNNEGSFTGATWWRRD